MRWWMSPGCKGDICDVLVHLNEAMDSFGNSSTTRICELYFHSFNKLWNSHARFEAEPSRADTPALIALLKSLSVDEKHELLENECVRELVHFVPEVMNHYVLKKRGYNPFEPISDQLRHESTEQHRYLKRDYDGFFAPSPKKCLDDVLKKLAEFLFVVRSNIAHGEKTPYGPDLKKIERDEKICTLVVPVQKLIVELILGKPGHKLIAYGTLRPGQPNEELLNSVKGTWCPCSIQGTIQTHNSMPRFRWEINGESLKAMLLISPLLESQWENLDRFEGSDYQRQLIPAITEDNEWIIANVYEGKRRRV